MQNRPGNLLLFDAHYIVIHVIEKLFKLSNIVLLPADFRRFFAPIFAENQSAVLCDALNLSKISGKSCFNMISLKV